MVQRTPFRDRGRALVLLVPLALLLAVIFAYVFQSARQPGFLSPGVPECRAAFQHARTARDSAIVDVQQPSSGPQKDPNAPTCGTLRVTRQIR